MPPHLSFRPRVLIVDDAGPCRAALRALLEGKGFRVEEAADGAAGLRKAMAWRPEAAVVGTDVPPTGGCAVARGLRAVFGRDTLVIGRTRPGRPLDPERARSDGFDHLLSDTADPSDLLAALRTMPDGEGVPEPVWVGSPG
jgi:CheY-like chemotaxis protein